MSYLTLAIAHGKTVQHKWPAHGITMIKWSFQELFLNHIEIIAVSLNNLKMNMPTFMFM